MSPQREMLCSRHPFGDKVFTPQMIAAHVVEAPPVLGKVAQHVPADVCAIVMRCLAKMRSEPPLTGARSVAVLPFDVVGGDTADTYFAEGMADELTTVLSKLPTLRVASRSAAFSLGRSGKRSAREIGTTLGVQTVLEGSVQRAIARAFGPSESVSADSTIGATGTSNVEAYDLYLRARYLLERRGKGVSLAVDYFQQAIDRDAGFARAYAGLADALDLMPYFSSVPASPLEARARGGNSRAGTGSLARGSVCRDRHGSPTRLSLGRRGCGVSESAVGRTLIRSRAVSVRAIPVGAGPPCGRAGRASEGAPDRPALTHDIGLA